MIIREIRTTALFAPFRNPIADAARAIAGRDILLVEVGTDEGLSGLGFLTGLGVAHGSEIKIIKTIIDEALAPGLVGQDALRPEWHWESMYKATTRFGRRGGALRAISGVDMALWDLMGRKAGLSVHRLLGGYRDKVLGYASGGFYTPGDDLGALVDEMLSYLDQGFKMVKIKVGRDIRLDAKRVAAVRKGIGEEVPLLVDANESWTYLEAWDFIQRVKDFDVFWLEEPVAPDDLDGYAWLSERSPIPIAAGENEYTRYGFRDLIDRRAVHVVQPDVTRVGGISEWIKVSAMAAARKLNCIPHAVHEIHVSLACAVSNSPFIEIFPKDQYLQTFIGELLLRPEVHSVDQGGYIRAPQEPGLGLALNQDLVKKYQI
ncbi:MAG: mandelate racemase/muconate lactonizing enzyme family protein [Deltaproteobacteria bacterium]|jgi:D-arabinonate dehydratase|nr:mandelate racemase/muconate lactonizing enzyme family protein [Deltaproteobacteria bacterium]